MADAHIGFLYKAASTLVKTDTSPTQSKLKSYYLMRCMQITKGYGLPDKHFSPKTRCPHCCIEWNKISEITIKHLKLSKRQKKRIRSQNPTIDNPDPQALLHSNNLERICSFCKHSTVTPIPKPAKETVGPKQTEKEVKMTELRKNNKRSVKKANVKSAGNKTEINIYYNAKEVFSLNNKNNTLTSPKDTKIIKNNKRKKDKFAGLCQQAVLTAAKLKEAKNKNTLVSFLKTSK